MSNPDNKWVWMKAVAFMISFLVVLVLLSVLKGFAPANLERYAHGIAGMIAALLVTWLFLRWDKRTWKDAGMQWSKSTLPKFFGGTAFGLGIGALALLGQVWFSGYSITPVPRASLLPVFVWLLALVPLAWMEEIAFRGYPFFTLHRAYGPWVTQFLIALLFALYHVANGWGVAQSFLGPGIWSFLFGWAAYYGNGISVPTGLHFGLNAALSLLGAKKEMPGLWKITVPGAGKDVLVAEQTYGIVLQLLVLLVALFLTAKLFYRKEHAHARN